LVNEIILHYDARSKKHKKTSNFYIYVYSFKILDQENININKSVKILYDKINTSTNNTSDDGQFTFVAVSRTEGGVFSKIWRF